MPIWRPRKARRRPLAPSASATGRCSTIAKITAPFDGVVTQRFANFGTLVQAGTNSSTQAMPLVRLSEDDKFRLVIPVPEAYVSYIHLGDPVSVNVSSLNRTFPGKVARFSTDVKEETRTMHTEVDVHNTPDRTLVPGMYADATIQLQQKTGVVAVPSQAINRRGDKRHSRRGDPIQSDRGSPRCHRHRDCRRRGNRLRGEGRRTGCHRRPQRIESGSNGDAEDRRRDGVPRTAITRSPCLASPSAILTSSSCCAWRWWCWAVTAIVRMPVDLFPPINIPVVVVATFYNGMPPEDIETDITNPLERFFTQASGLDHMESRSMLGVSIIKAIFQTGTNADADVTQLSNLAMADLKRLPPGTLPPLVMKLDASSLPVALVTVKGEGLNETQLHDLAQFQIRNQIAVVNGAEIPAVFGGKYRQAMVYVDPYKLMSRQLSLMDVVGAVNDSNLILPAGDVKIGPTDYYVYSNSLVKNVSDLNNLPIKTVGSSWVSVGDVGEAKDASQLQYNIVRIDGQKSAYIPIMKSGGDSNTIAGGERRPQPDRAPVRPAQAAGHRHCVRPIRFR